jgi:hypothetical protein
VVGGHGHAPARWCTHGAIAEDHSSTYGDRIAVHGIVGSLAMLDKLRSKPVGDKITAARADFEQIPLDRQFRLIYVVFNTFYALSGEVSVAVCRIIHPLRQRASVVARQPVLPLQEVGNGLGLDANFHPPQTCQQ